MYRNTVSIKIKVNKVNKSYAIKCRKHTINYTCRQKGNGKCGNMI